MYESFPVHPSARCFFFFKLEWKHSFNHSFIHSFIHAIFHLDATLYGSNLLMSFFLHLQAWEPRSTYKSRVARLFTIVIQVSAQTGIAVWALRCATYSFFIIRTCYCTWLLPTPLSDPPNNRQKRRSVIIVKKLKSTLRSGASLDNLDKENSIVNSPVRTQPDTAKGINSPNRIPPDAAKGLIVSLNHKGNCRSLEEGAIGGRRKRRQRGMSLKGSSAR